MPFRCPAGRAECLSVADHGYVLKTGRIVLGGKPDELWGNEAIHAAYLGGHAKVNA